MGRVKKTIPNLINGVSQQPPSLRFPTQCEEQINGYANVVNGLAKRPPTELLAKLLDDPEAEAFTHVIDRDRANRFIAIFCQNDLKVFDFEGNPQKVKFPAGKEYLATTNPAGAFTATTVADYTFIVNKERTVRVQDPMEGITLQPVYERRWVLSFRPVPGNSTSYDFSKSSQYRSLVGGHWVTEYPPTKLVDWGHHGRANINRSFHAEPSLQNYLQKVARKIREVYGWSVEVIGQELHVRTETMGAFVDKSIRCSVRKQAHKSHWHVGESSAPYSTLVSSKMKKVLLGYKSPKGDMLPPRAVRKHEGIFFVKTPDYATTYTAIVNDRHYSVTTSATERGTVNTEYIASKLRDAMLADGSLTRVIDVTLSGSLIRLTGKANSYNFSITARDTKGDAAIVAIKEQVQEISDLPARCFPGFTTAVVGTGTIDERYYVQYDLGDDNKGTGTWTEVAAPGLNNELLPATMPHQLIAEADGTFTFKPAKWKKRKAGDEDTNPEPSFVNQTINDVFFYRNRLGILSGENMILSENGDYWNFYPITVRTTLDSAPIDIGSTVDRVSILKHAVSFNEKLLIFSDRVQFTPNTGDNGVLTASTLSMDVATRFEAQLKAKPVGAGQNVFFPVKLGAYSGVREYFVAPETQINNAADITAHVPTYIAGDIVDMAASSSHDVVVCRTNDARDTLYAYTYFWSGSEKVQSAWSRWVFAGEVLSVNFIEARLFIVIKRKGGIMLESIDLSRFNTPVSEGWPTEILLDQRKLIHKGDTKPAAFDGEGLRAVLKSGEVREGKGLAKLYDSDNKALADHFLGLPYAFQYTFSEQVMTEGEQGKINLLDRLQLHRMSLSYNGSGYFRIIVSSPYNAGRVHTFSGMLLGSLNNILGKANLEDGTFKFPIRLQSTQANIMIQSDSHLPCSFQSAEWSGRSRPRARLIG